MNVAPLSRAPATKAVIKGAARIIRATENTPRISSVYTQSRPMHVQSAQSASSHRPTSITKRSPNLPPQFHSSMSGAKTAYSTTISSNEPTITPAFESVTGTFQYLVVDPLTKSAAIIDPVLNYDPVTQAITTTTADSLIDTVKTEGYTVEWILETHAHADHLTAASYLRNQLEKLQGTRPKAGIGKRIRAMQVRFAERYGVPIEECEGVFDKLFEDDEVFMIGKMEAKAMHLPGHTPDHLGYMIGDNIICGDSVFHIDIGTARCDFPGGSVASLWQSTRKLLSLPDEVKIWTGHDYPPKDRTEPVAWMSVKQHREMNKHIKEGTKEEEFVQMRSQRDAELAAPRLLHQSLQFNIRGGALPRENGSGLRLMHLPLKVKESW